MGCQPGGGPTTTPRGWDRYGVLEMDEGQAGQQLLGVEHWLAGSPVKRALSALSAARADTVFPCPRSSVKGWANV